MRAILVDFGAGLLVPIVVAIAGAPIVDLDEEWGSLNSVAGCAYALVTLARERLSGDSA